MKRRKKEDRTISLWNDKQALKVYVCIILYTKDLFFGYTNISNAGCTGRKEAKYCSVWKGLKCIIRRKRRMLLSPFLSASSSPKQLTDTSVKGTHDTLYFLSKNLLQNSFK